MATINLGAIKFNWKGAYNSSTTYAVDDVVSSGGNSYVCIQAHSNQAVGNATAYWNIMSSAGTNGTNGTNGTDVGTVITTQGDILYRDGSGLQRLPKGTAGQVLQMNSGATAPEYGTVSSDFVRINTFTLGSASTTWNLDNIFSSTYDQYQVQINARTGDNGHNLQLRLLDNSGSQITGSYYRSYNGGGETTPSSSNNGQSGGRRWDEDHWRLTGSGSTWANHGSDYSINYSGTLFFYRPNATSGLGRGYKSFYGLGHYLADTDQRFMTTYISGYYNSNSLQSRGLSFFSTTGNGIGANSVITVYGLKTS